MKKQFKKITCDTVFFVVTTLLVLLTVAVYWHSTNNGFVNLDDAGYVTENQVVLKGLSLANFFWSFTALEMSNWHPLTWLSYMVDAQLYGLDPWGYHLTNIVLHSLNVALVFAVFRRMTKAPWESALVAMLFAIHPLHVESVAWISERKDVLSTLFFLLTLLCYTRYVEKPRACWYSLSLFLFALGLMAKPMLVTLPLILIALDYWPLERFTAATPRRSLILEKVPFLLLAVASSIITIYAQNVGKSIVPLTMVPIKLRIYNALLAYFRYIQKTLIPTDMSVYYPYFLHFDWLKFVFLSFLFIAITGYFVRGRKKRPYLLVGWFWFVIILIPVIGIIQVGEQAMADRYTYISQTGLTIAFIWTLGDIREHINLPKIIGILSASVLIAVLSCISYVQTSYWKDGVALFGHALNVTRPNPSVHYHLAVALSNQGSFSESAYHYAESIRMRPNFADAHFGLGYVLAQQGRMGEALEEYRFALMLAPRNSFVYSNMGLVLLSIGKKEEALDCFSKALEMNPHDELARYNLVRLKGQLKMLPP